MNRFNLIQNKKEYSNINILYICIYILKYIYIYTGYEEVMFSFSFLFGFKTPTLFVSII